MARLGIFIGVFLMVLSFFLLMMLIETNNPPTMQLIAALHCKPGETAVQEMGEYIRRSVSSSGGYETWFYCVDANGDRRDITMAGFLTLAGGFAIPFVLGLLLMLGGIFSAARRATRNITTDLWSGNNLTMQTVEYDQPGAVMMSRSGTIDSANLSPQQQQQIQQAFNMLDKMLPGMNLNANLPAGMAADAGSTDLTGRLQQLEQARQQGLISQSEYDRLRQQILDSM